MAYYDNADPYDILDDNNPNQNIFEDYSIDKRETAGSHWFPGLVASGLACVSAIICLVIGWVLYAHWKNGWMLTFAIISTVAFLLTAYFAFWCFCTGRSFNFLGGRLG